MTDAQLTFCAKMIATAMKAGEMDKVTEIYSKVSGTASMEDAAKLETLIAAAMA